MKALVSGQAAAAALLDGHVQVRRLEAPPIYFGDTSLAIKFFDGCSDTKLVDVESVEQLDELIRQKWSADRCIRLFLLLIETLPQIDEDDIAIKHIDQFLHIDVVRHDVESMMLAFILPRENLDKLESLMSAERAIFFSQFNDFARKIINCRPHIEIVSNAFDQLSEMHFVDKEERRLSKISFIDSGVFREIVYGISGGQRHSQILRSICKIIPNAALIFEQWIHLISMNVTDSQYVTEPNSRRTTTRPSPELEYQTTLRSTVNLEGIGIHSGAPVKIHLKPSVGNSGIVFIRSKSESKASYLIHAKHSRVLSTELCTVIGDSNSLMVATIEHLMSACAGMFLDNVIIEIDGNEVPIMDGSALAFVDAIKSAGIVNTRMVRRYIQVLREVRVQSDDCIVELLPSDDTLSLDVEIEFQSPVIGCQRRQFDLDSGMYIREIARARTFGFMKDIETLWKHGFALGASLDNTIAVTDERILNPEGLRYRDEFVRHKILDAIGNLSLAGLPLLANYRSIKGTQRLNYRLIDALFADRRNYTITNNKSRNRKDTLDEFLKINKIESLDNI